MPRPAMVLSMRKFISFVSVQPPIIPMPGVRFTVSPFAFFATKVRSRVSLIWRAISPIALSQEMGSHLSEPGLRTWGLVRRLELVMSSRSVMPLGQSVPRLMGWSGSPSTCTTLGFTFFALSPSVWMITPQETEQYGQVLLVSVVRAIFNSRISARARLRSNPSATAPPTAAAEPFRKVLRFTGWLLVVEIARSLLRDGPACQHGGKSPVAAHRRRRGASAALSKKRLESYRRNMLEATRSAPRLDRVSSPDWRVTALKHSRQAAHEQVVEEGDRHAGDEAGSHQRPPEVHVPAHQEGGHPDADGKVAPAVDEGEPVDELLHHQREAEDHHREQPGHRHGQDHADESPQSAHPVHHRRLLDVPGDGLEEPHHQPGAEGDGKARIGHHQRPETVLEAQRAHHLGERDEEDGRRDQVSEEDPDPQLLSEGPGQPRQRVARRYGDQQRDQDHQDADEDRVADPAHEERLLEQDAQVLQRRSLRVPEGKAVRIEQVVGLLERGDRHPSEREGGEQAEEQEDGAVGHLGPDLARFHTTSARRASRKRRIAAAASTGKRKSAIAEAPARSPPSMPLKNASDASTCVMS